MSVRIRGEKKNTRASFSFRGALGYSGAKEALKLENTFLKAFSGFSAVQSEFARHRDLTVFHNLETKADHTLDDFQV